MNDVNIEYVNTTNNGNTVIGNWQPIRSGVMNNPQVILQAMQDVKRMLGENVRVRAVDGAGRLVDILN